MKKIKKSQIVEIHKITVIEEDVEEIYPFTGQKIIRPKVNFKLAILLSLLAIALVGVLSWGILKFLSIFEWYEAFKMPWGLQFALLYLLGVLLTAWLFAKWILIFLIRVYQKYAPYEVRSKCVYIPNCSEYMILAIKKYGLIKGVKMGKQRFDRCDGDHGGEDYP